MLIPLDILYAGHATTSSHPTKTLNIRDTTSSSSSSSPSPSTTDTTQPAGFNHTTIGVIFGVLGVLFVIGTVYGYHRFRASPKTASMTASPPTTPPTTGRRSHRPHRAQTEPLPVYSPRREDLEVPPPAYIKDSRKYSSVAMSDMTAVSGSSTLADEASTGESGPSRVATERHS